MLSKSALKDWLTRSHLERDTKLLLVLATDPENQQPVSQIRKAAQESGLPSAKSWNISHILKHSDGKAANVGDGWVLTSAGKEYVQQFVSQDSKSSTKHAADLRVALAAIKNADTREFVSEAIECYENKYWRAAVVLSWVGAVSLLYAHVVDLRLSDFNVEAQKRDPKWRPAKTADGLARMKERDFLDVIEALGIIGKNVKEELQNCLKLRNSCGHPSSLKIADNRVTSHIEILLLNVFQQFT